MTSRRAFTLVELLVVIAIIGLLSAIAVISLKGSSLKARNAKRMADIKQLITVFNTGLNVSGGLPTQTGCISSVCNWGGITADATIDAFMTPFMPTKPVNPPISPDIASSGYVY
jgi:prepilin-type N-terminal cleavage/methylation domain-containing protein